MASKVHESRLLRRGAVAYDKGSSTGEAGGVAMLLSFAVGRKEEVLISLLRQASEQYNYTAIGR